MELPDDHGGRYHVIYNSATTRVVVNVWESPSGTLVALTHDFVNERVDFGSMTEELHEEYQ